LCPLLHSFDDKLHHIADTVYYCHDNLGQTDIVQVIFCVSYWGIVGNGYWYSCAVNKLFSNF